MLSPIPSSVAELTPAWFSEIFDADVTAVEVLDAHSGTTGRALVRLESSSSEIPATAFVKLRPFDPDQHAFLTMVGLGVSEAQLYASVGGELPVRVPGVYHSACQQADGSFIMVLEDLTASGCRFCSAEDDDVVGVAESLMDELALLHGAYWGQDLSWLATHAMTPSSGPDQAEKQKMGAMIVQSALDQFSATMPPTFSALGEFYVQRHADIVALGLEGDRTLIHGDSHIGNLFVDNGRTAFYDWAAAMRLPGMRDVAYFFCNSLPTEIRRAEENALLARYRGSLGAQGIVLSDEQVHDQYRIFAVSSWIAATTTAAMGSKWQPAEVAMRATQRATQAIEDLGVVDFLHERIS